MSNLETIGLILATLVGGGALLTYLSELTNKHAEVITTGLKDGIPVSRDLRAVLLYRVYFLYMGGLIAFSIAIALGLLLIAENVSDPGIKTLAYVTAVIPAFSGVSWSILGTWTGIDCARAIGKAER
ncbi:MAG: hypothetical protein HKN10_12115 [Myxococcales bacterium]|nr:hypothetical protein [Myxococcales bacterium]